MERRAASDDASLKRDWWWIFDPRLSLRARAALIFGGGAVLFTVLLSWLAGTFLERSLERQLGPTFETLAFQISDKLDRVIYERYRELQLAASLAPFRASDVSAADRRQLLEAMQTSTRDFAWIGFADTTGRIQVAARGTFEGTPADARPWFLLGRERPYAGGLKDVPALARDLTFDEERSLKFIELAVPVHAANGQFLGVLGAYVHWDWAREVQVSVVPELARRQRIGATIYSSQGEVLLDSGGSGWTLPPDAPVISDSRRFRGTLLEHTSMGTNYITGFARSRGFREFRGLGWLITVRQPTRFAFAPARELQRRVAGWGFLFAAALVATSWIGAGRFARRLRVIRLAADRIREGDVLTVMPHPRGGSELAQMCDSLGKMVDELRAKGDRREEASAKESSRSQSTRAS